jgi:hypothetical protein
MNGPWCDWRGARRDGRTESSAPRCEAKTSRPVSSCSIDPADGTCSESRGQRRSRASNEERTPPLPRRGHTGDHMPAAHPSTGGRRGSTRRPVDRCGSSGSRRRRGRRGARRPPCSRKPAPTSDVLLTSSSRPVPAGSPVAVSAVDPAGAGRSGSSPRPVDPQCLGEEVVPPRVRTRRLPTVDASTGRSRRTRASLPVPRRCPG